MLEISRFTVGGLAVVVLRDEAVVFCSGSGVDFAEADSEAVADFEVGLSEVFVLGTVACLGAGGAASFDETAGPGGGGFRAVLRCQCVRGKMHVWSGEADLHVAILNGAVLFPGLERILAGEFYGDLAITLGQNFQILMVVSMDSLD